MKILQHFSKNTSMSHGGNRSRLYTKEVENFCFNLQCIHKGKAKDRSDLLKNARKIVQPANENFTTFWKKHAYDSWPKSF